MNAYGVLDTPPEPRRPSRYDDLTTLAASICRAPLAPISFVDSDRLWFKSRVGFDSIEIANGGRNCVRTLIE